MKSVWLIVLAPFRFLRDRIRRRRSDRRLRRENSTIVAQEQEIRRLQFEVTLQAKQIDRLAMQLAALDQWTMKWIAHLARAERNAKELPDYNAGETET